MRILGIVALGAALAGCASNSADRLAEQRANEATCKSSIAHGNTESMAEWGAGVKRDLEYIRTHPAPGPVDTAYVPAPVYNAISGRRAASAVGWRNRARNRECRRSLRGRRKVYSGDVSCRNSCGLRCGAKVESAVAGRHCIVPGGQASEAVSA